MKHLGRLVGIGIAGAMALATSSPALAHAKLVGSSPAANAAVATGPTSITLTFNERLVPAFSKFELVMPEHAGMKVPVATIVSRDGKRIVGTLENRLSPGAYKVIWTAAGSDGHKLTGELAFRVR
jgi:methionine-rich copper-binding protein CopC